MKWSERQKWFLERIGERVYRNHYNCCEHCERVYKDGLIITDGTHATYLYDIECESAIAGNPIHYFDTKEEVLKYESKLNRGIK